MIEDRRRIEDLKDRHKGERCFVIATGPSLLKTNFALIRDEILFGVNTFYRGFKKFGINKCDYYAVSDGIVLSGIYKDVLNLDTTLFIGLTARTEYLQNYNEYKDCRANLILLKPLDGGAMWKSKRFSTDLTKGVSWGFTVVIDICLQVCWWLGFDTVYLLGCDHDYTGKQERFDGSKTEVRAGGAVGNWQPIFASHEICKRAYERSGREIINCTIGGKLDIYKRKDLKEVVMSKANG